jgi:hypothetical protein
MSEPLAPAVLADTLVGLPAWRPAGSTIERDVPTTADAADDLVARIGELSAGIGRPVAVGRGPDKLTLTLGGEGGVVALDIAMASRIEDLVAQTTDLPAEHGSHEVAPAQEVADPDPHFNEADARGPVL